MILLDACSLFCLLLFLGHAIILGAFPGHKGLKKEERTELESTKSTLECTQWEHATKPCC
jgi:hypothetical protein